VELPEKQGLKHITTNSTKTSAKRVAVELPEKQGLKLSSEEYEGRGEELQWNFQKNKD